MIWSLVSCSFHLLLCSRIGIMGVSRFVLVFLMGCLVTVSTHLGVAADPRSYIASRDAELWLLTRDLDASVSNLALARRAVVNSKEILRPELSGDISKKSSFGSSISTGQQTITKPPTFNSQDGKPSIPTSRNPVDKAPQAAPKQSKKELDLDLRNDSQTLVTRQAKVKMEPKQPVGMMGNKSSKPGAQVTPKGLTSKKGTVLERRFPPP